MKIQRNPKSFKVGDTLLIKGIRNNVEVIELHKVIEIKNTFEIILKNKGNIWFNFTSFITGISWVKEIFKIK